MTDVFLKKFLKKYNIPDIDENKDLIEVLYSYDPSSNKKYLYWMYNMFKEDHGSVRWFDHDYWDRIMNALGKLENYPQRFKNANLSTDINSYRNTDEFISASEKAYQKSNKKIELKNDVDLVDEFDGIVILYPSTAEASCYYGKGTRWCVTNEGTYDQYMLSGDLFFILNKNSSGDDYKTALYVDIFNKVTGFDSDDKPLGIHFEDVTEIEYNSNDYGGSITYPKRVSYSISKYLKTIVNLKPNKVLGSVFKSWVKSRGDDLIPDMYNADEMIFTIKKRTHSGFRTIGEQYLVLDDNGVNEYIKDEFNGFDDLFYSGDKIKSLIRAIGEDKIISYINLEDLFIRILSDDTKFRFYYECGLDEIDDFNSIYDIDDVEIVDDLSHIKDDFMSDPVRFYNENIFVNTKGSAPKYTNYKGLGGILFYYDDCCDIEKLVNENKTICIDKKSSPIIWEYNGKKYNIIHIYE
jgi:hypothetical protein